MLVAENMSKEEMVKEAVEEAKAKAAKETGEQEEQAEETVEETAEQEEVSEEAEEASEEEETEEGSGFMKKFGRKNKKDKKDEQIEELKDKLTRQMADFERGIAAVPEDEKANPFAEGMEKIYKQLMTTLEEIGVKPIEAVGQEFDPDFHNAVMHVEDEEVGENIITEEFQKGYLYRDSVVRHSMVKVAN